LSGSIKISFPYWNHKRTSCF